MRNILLILILAVMVENCLAFPRDGIQLMISDKVVNEILPLLIKAGDPEIRNPRLTFGEGVFIFECDAKPAFIDYHVEAKGTVTVLMGGLDINVREMKANGSSIGGLGKVVLMTLADGLNDYLKGTPIKVRVIDPLIDDDYHGGESDDISGIVRFENCVIGLPEMYLTKFHFYEGYVCFANTEEQPEQKLGDIQLNVGEDALNKAAEAIESIMAQSGNSPKLRVSFSSEGAVWNLVLPSSEQVKIHLLGGCPDLYHLNFKIVSIEPEALLQEELLAEIVKASNTLLGRAFVGAHPHTCLKYSDRTLNFVLDLRDFVKTRLPVNYAVNGFTTSDGYFSLSAMSTNAPVN
ncbi:MAG: hypothetical protein PHW04_12915 [Candidatus Wallbacteria bacterium]|nr:hypothetical protein [Candidatus Wallbacteria bacterium]